MRLTTNRKQVLQALCVWDILAPAPTATDLRRKMPTDTRAPTWVGDTLRGLETFGYVERVTYGLKGGPRWRITRDGLNLL